MDGQVEIGIGAQFAVDVAQDSAVSGVGAGRLLNAFRIAIVVSVLQSHQMPEQAHSRSGFQQGGDQFADDSEPAQAVQVADFGLIAGFQGVEEPLLQVWALR